MKKILTQVSLAILIAATAQAADTFKSGFKIGVGAGYKRHSSTLKKNFNPDPVLVAGGSQVFDQSDSVNANKALGQIHLGYDYIKNNHYSALELDYRYGPSKLKKSTNNAYVTPFDPRSYETTKLEQKHKHDIGLTGKLGTLIKPNFALYVIANARYGSFVTKLIRLTPATNVNNASNLTTQKKKLFGFGGGFGCAYAMRNHTSLALDLTYDFYKHTKAKKNAINSENLGVAESSLKFRTRKTRVFNAIVKLSKTF